MKESSNPVYESSPFGVRIQDAQYELMSEKPFSKELPLFQISEKEVSTIQNGICELHDLKDGALIARWMVYEGKKQGVCTYFFPAGQVSAECWYVDDLLWGKALEYFPEGMAKASYGYHKGMLHGPFRTWSREGTLQLKGKYVDGLPHGVFEQLDREGQWRRCTHFSNGRRHGADSGFSEDGYLLFLDMWKDGVRQNSGFVDCVQRYLEAEIRPRPR